MFSRSVSFVCWLLLWRRSKTLQLVILILATFCFRCVWMEAVFPDIYERFSPTYFISILVFFAFRTDFRSSYIMNSTIAGIEVSGERSVFNLASKVIRIAWVFSLFCDQGRNFNRSDASTLNFSQRNVSVKFSFVLCLAVEMTVVPVFTTLALIMGSIINSHRKSRRKGSEV